MMKESDKFLKEINEITRKVWARFVKIYPALAAHKCPLAVFDNRLVKTAAICEPDNKRVRVSFKLYRANKQEYINQLIPHELAHEIDYRLFIEPFLNGKPEPTDDEAKKTWHAGNWAKIMIAYGIEPKATHELET